MADSIVAFINSIASDAQKVAQKYNVLPSLIIAQACLESNFGKSALARLGKNLFGVKGSFNGQSIVMRTAEYDSKGTKYYVNAKFAKYLTWYDSLEHLGKLYKNGVSWDKDKYRAVIGEKDYKKAAKAVQTAEYATDPRYAEKLISLIETYNLTRFDSTADAPVKEAAKEEDKDTAQAFDTYKVKRGDTFSELAKRFGTTVAELQRINGIKDANKIYAGQTLKVPTAPVYHIVKRGDTVYELAVKYGTTIAKIKALNNLKDVNKIYVGQKLRVK